jgi:hypothetical protein
MPVTLSSFFCLTDGVQFTPPPPVTPGAADRRFLEPDETLTLWQFSVAYTANKRAAARQR